MKFEYEENGDYTKFIAIPENEKETLGFRAQGPYVPIQLTNNTLVVKYVSTNLLHSDIIAAICITAFYPFIHTTATMPFPVSSKFASGLQMDILPQHDKTDGVYKATEPIIITNIDEYLEPYSHGKNTVIAYGGGMDSTSIACLFPEFDLIHSTDLNSPNNNVKLFVHNNLENNIHTIESNCKQISSPCGFTTFANIYITPLILSADLNIKNIMCGSILGSTCLSNGTKYFPQFNETRRNRWERFYNHIGIHIFSPIAGCSELITSKIVCEYGLHDKVIYCELNNGLPCDKCTKCLRKQLELTYHGKLSTFEHYDLEWISKFLKKRPLYFGHIFIETIKTILNNDSYSNESIQILKHIEAAIADVIDRDTSFLNKIYTKSFCYFPEDIKDRIIERLFKYTEPMNVIDELCLENWDITGNAKSQPLTINQLIPIENCSTSNVHQCKPDDIQTIMNENVQLRLENAKLHKNIDTIMRIIDQINITRLELTL